MLSDSLIPVAAPVSPERRRSPAAIVAICAGIVALIWASFGQTLWHSFVTYDDNIYVYDNRQITSGLSWSAVRWAFTEPHASNWHPLTTLSHMADWQLFGANAGGHHFTNVLLHSAAAVALFLVLRRMTGAFWRSALVAAVFAIHPLRAESVAWVAERKDVLSGLLFMLTLGAYVRYVRQPSMWRYALVLLVFASGLMAKPMLVTLPFVLLLLDRWPLGRFGAVQSWRDRALRICIVEKLPLLALSAASSAITFFVQKHGGLQSDAMPLAIRLSNAVLAYATYIRQLFWPAKLAPFYPHTAAETLAWQTALAAVVLLGITATVLLFWKTRAYLATGWFWFLGMLVPVIGIVQVGSQAWADRYTYLPHIGLLIAAAWAAGEVATRFQIRRAFLFAGAGLVLVALAFSAWAQAARWRDSETLWSHTLRVTPDNDVAHIGVGNDCLQRGDIDGALSHYERALEIRSRYRHSRYDLLLAIIHNNIGGVLQRKGRLDEALAHFRAALEAQPDYLEATVNLAYSLLEQRETTRALEVLDRAVVLQPESADLHRLRGDAFLQQGAEARAVESYEQALTSAPDTLMALNNLTWLLATSPSDEIRNAARAVTVAERAVRLSGGNDPLFLHALAAAYAEKGDFRQASMTAERAFALATKQSNAALGTELQRCIALYRSGTPLRYDTTPN
jgi:tetratricopeptide (TPR) repeat protein